MTLRTALVLSGDAKGAVAAIETAVDAVERLEHANEQASREAKALAAAEQAAMSAAASAGKLADDEARKAAAAQARLVAAYDPVIAKQRKLVESLADIHKLYKDGAITAEEMTRAVERQQAVFNRGQGRGATPAAAAPAVETPEASVIPAAGAIALSNQQLAQMQFQLNDLGVQLASGSSPFVAITQQGSQIAQMFSAGTGPTAAIRALGAGVMAFVTNPLNLMVVGIAAASAAIPMLWSAFSGPAANTAQDALEGFDGWLKEIKASSEEAADAAARILDAGQSLDELRAGAALTREELEGAFRVSLDGLLGQVADLDYLAQESRDELVRLYGEAEILGKLELTALVGDLDQGRITAAEFRQQMSRILLSPGVNAEVRALAVSLFNASQEARTLQARMEALDAANAQIGVRDLSGAARVGGEAGDTFPARRFLEDERERERAARDAARGDRRGARDAERAAAQRAANAEMLAGYEAELAALSLSGAAREAALRQLEIEKDTRAAIKALGEEAGAGEIARIRALIPAIAEQTQAMERQKQLIEEQQRAAQRLASGFASVANQIARGADVADTLLSKVIDIGANLVTEGFQSLFGGGRSSAGGGILSTLFRAVLPAAAPALAPAGNPFVMSSLYHEGGTVGRPTGMSRAVPWAVFDNAPRAHSGGRAALAPGEVPVIAKEGEEIGWPAQLAARYGGGRQIVINQTIDARGAQAGVADQISAAMEEFNRKLPARIAEIDSNPRGR